MAVPTHPNDGEKYESRNNNFEIEVGENEYIIRHSSGELRVPINVGNEFRELLKRNKPMTINGCYMEKTDTETIVRVYQSELKFKKTQIKELRELFNKLERNYKEKIKSQ